MDKCGSCNYLERDFSVGYFECAMTDEFSDSEYEEYAKNGYIEDCPYYDDEIC